MNAPLSTLLAAAVLAAGIAVGGWFVADGLREARTGDRFVTVKGLAEREVKADLALWPMRFVATSNALDEAQAKSRADAEAIVAFLTEAGIGRDEIAVQSLEVTDLLAQAYRSGPVESRFIVTQTLMVRSRDVDRIASASQRLGDLVARGVVLSGEGPATGPAFVFTGLNAIKPDMIAEATRDARAAGEQFAADSGSRLGGIRSASQGLFQILPRDAAPGETESRQINKTVRVVGTIEYALVR
ncbi:MAG TPA: SIMPL domain-containing protein [Rhodospirillales bacterium]|nr:SIMPL domain-containing protein [Rhodospirillales bacterium]